MLGTGVRVITRITEEEEEEEEGWCLRVDIEARSRGSWSASAAVGSHSSHSDGCLIGWLLSALMGPESRHAASAAATFIPTLRVLHHVDCTFLFSSH